jgi:hypothetical protein
MAAAGIGVPDSRYSAIPFPFGGLPQNDERGFSQPGVAVNANATPRICLLALLAIAAFPAHAHHGTAPSYDLSKQWTKDAVITSFHYANPHPQLFFDLTDDKGNVEHWSAEMLPNPAGLLRVGWTRVRSTQALAPGTKVKITISPAKAGGPVGLVVKITDMQGAELVSDRVPYPESNEAVPAKP